MAEGIGNHIYKNTHTFYSAGTEPGVVNQNAVKVMEEIGIDITDNYAKSLSKLAHIQFDLAVTLCDSAKETCPFISNTKKLIHKGFPDPSTSEDIEAFRNVRDQIYDYVRSMFE